MNTTIKLSLQLMTSLTVRSGLQPAAGQVAFAPPVNYQVGYQPLCVIAADVTANYLTNTLSVFISVPT